MPDFTVSQYGVDAYGRPVFMTAFMHDEFWLPFCEAIGRTPRILQGCYMERLGGGAAASSGAHDKAKCLDIETAGCTSAEIDVMVREARLRGGAGYRRDQTPKHGGMVQHLHVTVGADAEGDPMADLLWSSYLSGGDGLAAGDGRPGNAPDYEWRPSPLVLTPPEDPMADYAAQLTRIEQKLDRSQKRDVALRKSIKALGDMVETAVEDGSSDIKRRMTKQKNELLAAIAEAEVADQ